MILKLINQTASIKTYAGGLITLPASGNVTISTANQLATAVDGNLFSDVSQSLVFVSDNVNTFVGNDALVYLNRIVITQIVLTDGVNGPAAIKAASTAATASDPSLVVAFSPNSPLPPGTSAIGTVKSQLQDNAGSAITLGQKTMANSLPMVIASDQSAFPTSRADIAPATQVISAFDSATISLTGANGQVFYTGTPTINSAATFALSGIQSVNIQANLIGAAGTMVIEVSSDGGTFYFRPPVFQISTQSYTNGFTSPFMATVNVSGMTHVRVRGTVSWSGNATIVVMESLNIRSIAISEALPPGTNAIGTVKSQLQDNAGSAITLGQKIMSSSIPVVIASDQTHFPVEVQDGSGNGLTSTLVSGKQSLDTNITQQSTFIDKTGSGTISALNGTIVATTNGCSIVSFNITGTWVATIVIEGTLDGGTTWVAIDGDVDATDTIINNFTINSLITINCASYGQVRIRASLYTSGTLNAIWSAGTGLSLVEVYNTNAASLQATVRLSDGSGNAINSLSNGLNTNTKTVLTPSSPTAATVGVTSGSAVASNANRKGLILTNTSKNTISFGLGVAAVLNSGITLSPYGVWVMDEFNFTTAAINAIASAASSNLAIQEFTT